ncbi:hypothetical protein FDA94_24705 [Herbidospora galbida]|uniref:Uncharacterized protein n=1 Tax=Herbidospora galbida TaxID=2575442 RepID=A0A4U3MCW5_9ACTN|nr:hypothetical protein [Herbidospora galbida]TKK85597.1 hypothetical protein FDA94_24705 [Herbidospora galbida]
MDIIGERRLKKYLENKKDRRANRTARVATYITLASSGYVAAVLISPQEASIFTFTWPSWQILLGTAIAELAVGIGLFTLGAHRIVSTFLWLYNHENIKRAALALSALLLLLAFHFDFLAS